MTKIYLVWCAFVLNLLFCRVGVAETKADQQVEFKNITVARAGNQIISSRDVVVSAVISRWLDSKEKGNSKFSSEWILSMHSKDFRLSQTEVLSEVVLGLEADSFGVAEVSLELIKKLSSNFIEESKKWKDWKKLDVTQGEVEKTLVRKMRAKSFLSFRSDANGSKDLNEAGTKSWMDSLRKKYRAKNLFSPKLR